MTATETTGPAERAFVWAWLPGETEPVVAGQLRVDGERLVFNYGRSYLARPNAIALYLPELPLGRDVIRPPHGMRVAGCLRDAAPDTWGQRVILARHAGRLDRDSDTADLPLLTYLLESGSDRVGALDFQTSPSEYRERRTVTNLEEVQRATDKFLAGRGSRRNWKLHSCVAPRSVAPAPRWYSASSSKTGRSVRSSRSSRSRPTLTQL